MITNPHAGAASECITAHTMADITASQNLRLVRKDSILKIGTIINVSIGGPINIKLIATKTTGPSNSGDDSSFIIPIENKMNEMINDGIRLIRPVRKIYL